MIDLGFGNPDIPSPEAAVEKLREAALNPRNHRYSASRGIPRLRRAISDLYLDRFGVELDPDTQAITTIGAKEGFAHLMWVLLGPGDTALVPSPSYPIHIWAPILAGAAVAARPIGPETDFFATLEAACEQALAAAAGDRAVVPAQPDHGRRGSRVHAAHGRLRA